MVCRTNSGWPEIRAHVMPHNAWLMSISRTPKYPNSSPSGIVFALLRAPKAIAFATLLHSTNIVADSSLARLLASPRQSVQSLTYQGSRRRRSSMMPPPNRPLRRRLLGSYGWVLVS